jgi:arginine decarboxylase
VDQSRAPLFETLATYARSSGIYPFHTPGHKGGRFADDDLAVLVGREGLALDLPAMTATDNTLHPSGCVRDAQRLAAELFGARETFYLSAGSTLGVGAALLAAVPPGETLACVRNIHRSVVAGLVLCGGRPRFVPHDVLPECGALGPNAADVAAALDAQPRPAAMLLTRPTYYGLARELTDVVAVCHARGVPLIVDEAHGAHLHFLPPGGPPPALAAGADLVVQSCHKTLGSLVGSAQLHVGRQSLVEPERVRDALNMLQTTSPSYLLLASLDLVRRRMWREGRELFAAAVDEARQLEEEIDALPGMRVLRPERQAQLADHRRDPLRLVVSVSETGWTGYEVERFLRTEYRVEDEMADWFNVVYVLSPQDHPAARKRLIDGLRSVSERAKHGVAGVEPQASPQERWGLTSFDPSHPMTDLLQPAIPPLAALPRDAALAPKQAITLSEAAGRTCAEMVMFYPPGIPLLMPGEQVTPEVIDVCQRLLAAGAQPYASDPSLATLRVVAEGTT